MFRRFFKMIFFVVFVFAFYSFVLSNKNILERPFALQFEVPQWATFESEPIKVGYVLLAAFALGIVVSFLMGVFVVLHRRKELREKNRAIEALETELEELRSLYVMQRRQQLEAQLSAEAVRKFDQLPAAGNASLKTSTADLS